MLKKMLCWAAVIFTAAIVSAAPVEVTERYELSQNNAAVKAGEVIKFKLFFKGVPGAKLGSYKAYVHRKEAPAEFFQQNNGLIRWSNRKTKKVSNYDVIYLTDDKNFPQQLAAAECDVKINTSGMAPGDYAIGVQSWVVKDKKSHYKTVVFYLTITETDGKKFAPTAQTLPAAAQRKAAAKAPSWYKSCIITPAQLAGAAGTKYPIACDFTASDKYFFGGYCLKVLRKDAPKAFFDRAGLDMRYRFKDKKVDDYDYAVLVKFKHMPSVETQKFNMQLDTTGFPAGNYRLALEIRLVDRTTNKTSYPSVFFPLTVK